MMGTHIPDMQRGLDSVFECLHFDWTQFSQSSNHMAHLPHLATKNSNFKGELLAAFNNFNPNLVFMHIQSGDIIDIQTAISMTQSATVLNWTGDVRSPLPEFYPYLGKHIHSTLFTNMNDVDICKAYGVNADFLQVGFDSTHFNSFGQIGSYPEIIFLGSHYPNACFPLTQLRHDMVMRLRNEFGNRFGVYGTGWGGYENGNITNYEEEGKAYRSCKIAINLSHFAYRRYSSDRLFRILGSGAFCLTHNYPEIETDFEVGKDLVVWNDLDDLVNKIKRYLVRDSEREKIAMSGCFNVRTNFTWHHFAQNLEKIYNKINNINTNHEERQLDISASERTEI